MAKKDPAKTKKAPAKKKEKENFELVTEEEVNDSVEEFADCLNYHESLLEAYSDVEWAHQFISNINVYNLTGKAQKQFEERFNKIADSISELQDLLTDLIDDSTEKLSKLVNK